MKINEEYRKKLMTISGVQGVGLGEIRSGHPSIRVYINSLNTSIEQKIKETIPKNISFKIIEIKTSRG